MTEEQVRALVREALARHLGGGPSSPLFAPGVLPVLREHIAHGRFVFLAPTEPDAPCVVEPQVKCHHCGFCQSYGH